MALAVLPSRILWCVERYGGDGMDSSTPTPTLPRCGRWRVLQGREHIGGRPQGEACNTGRVELQTV